MSNPISKDDARARVLEHIRLLAEYWADESRAETAIDKCNGLAFSILNMFDRCSGGMPAMDITMRPHPEDEEYFKENGEDWWVDGMVINDDCHLHEYYYK